MLPVSFHTPVESAAASGNVAFDNPITTKAEINRVDPFIRCIKTGFRPAVWENP
jgi:hypothetical protein